jgi:metal-sulfur cluster biosynthetic enzyme
MRMRTVVTTAPRLTQEAIRTYLRDVQDPRSGLDIVTLGWVTGVMIARPEVTITLTLPGVICPSQCTLETTIARVIAPLLGTTRLRLRVCWSTDWHPDDE